jgi:hypothetical protein
MDSAQRSIETSDGSIAKETSSDGKEGCSRLVRKALPDKRRDRRPDATAQAELRDGRSWNHPMTSATRFFEAAAKGAQMPLR